MRELHIMAAFVHGMLATLHTIGTIYNFRRKNRLDAVIHSVAAIYSVRAVKNHIQTKEEK